MVPKLKSKTCFKLSIIALLTIFISVIFCSQLVLASDADRDEFKHKDKEDKDKKFTNNDEKRTSENESCFSRESNFDSKIESLKIIPRSTFLECLCREFPFAAREKFRNRLLKDAIKKFNRDRSIVITSFASGRLGNELQLVEKFYKKGFKDIVLNLIDPAYSAEYSTIPDNFVNYLKRNGINITVNVFSSIGQFKNESSESNIPKTDFFIDVDSSSYFDDSAEEIAKQSLSDNGRIYSLTSGWDYDKNFEPTGLYNFLTVTDKNGKSERNNFHTIGKIKIK